MEIGEALNVLGIKTEDLNERAVKKAYRELAKKYHTDINSEGNTELLSRITCAYKVIKGNGYKIKKRGNIKTNKKFMTYIELVNLLGYNKDIDLSDIILELKIKITVNGRVKTIEKLTTANVKRVEEVVDIDCECGDIVEVEVLGHNELISVKLDSKVKCVIRLYNMVLYLYLERKCK